MATRLLVLLVLLGGAVSRILWLDCLPGVNGDEPWVAIEAYRLTHGLPATMHINPGDRPQFSPCLWLFHLLFSLTGTTDFFYLRVPTVLASAVACLTIWRCWRKLLGEATPWVALLLWSLPVEIMFSRFGWDPSMMSMCVALTGAAVLSGRPILTVVAIVFGLLNHPFFVVALPFVPLFWLADKRPGWLKPALIATQACAWLAVLSTYLLGHALGAPEPWKVNFPRFCAGLPDLLSGQATFAYLVDPVEHPLGTPLSYAGGLVLLIGLNWLPWSDLRSRKPLLAALGGGLWLSCCGLFLALGTQGIVTPNDRNALMLIVLLVSWLVLRIPTRWLAPVVVTLSLLGLGLCAKDYFYSLRVYGTRSHRAFICAPEEPHRTAFRQALQWLAPGTVIIADDWHNFQPLYYLALPYKTAVLNARDPRVADLPGALRAGCVLVAHSNSPVMQALLEAKLPLRRVTISQAGGREVLEVVSWSR